MAYRCGDAGAHELVDLDVAAIQRHALDLLEADVLGERPAPDRDQDDVDGRGRCACEPSFVAIWKLTLVLVLLERLGVDGRGGVDGDPALLEDARQLLADLGILERHDAIGELDERDLGAEVAVHARPLDADGAGADDRRPDPGTSPRVSASSEVMIRRPSTVEVRAASAARCRWPG